MSSSFQDITSLTELAAKCVASHIPFEVVEHFYPPVPEQLQLRIAYWSFPDNEEDIRLYSCLANSSSDEFNRGEGLFKNSAVKDSLQIGFHLSATVVCQTPTRGQFNVAVTFDRRRISSCNCTCTSAAYWCSHIVAVCLHRINCPSQVCLRAPVSESLTRLQRDQLQKFAQYLISELPQQILPTAQRLLDELLSAQPTAINTVCGAPDPTAGASINEQTSWYLDERTLHDNIKRILIKFCMPAPIVFSDVNYLTNSAPPAAAEWSSLLRPLRGREPEGMWNLLSIVREMYRRCDRNAVRLLEIITEQIMGCDQILIWWFQTKLSLMLGAHSHSGGKHSNTHSNSTALQHACSSLCDEIVVLWRLAALNPSLAPDERDMLHAQFTAWHLKILDRVVKCRMMPSSYASNKHQQNARTDAELFVGFKPAIEACYLDWEDYPLAGITHSQDSNPIYYAPFTCFKNTDGKADGANSGGQLNATQALMANNKHYNYISSSTDHDVPAMYKQRCERFFRERFYISSSNNSSNSSSDSVHARVHQGAASGSGGSASAGGSGAVGGAANGDEVLRVELRTDDAPSTSAAAAAAAAGTALRNLANETNLVVALPPLAVVGDGDRSSASSEGFCENDDFGGDSSSNNMCVEPSDAAAAIAAVAPASAALKSLPPASSPPSFDVSSPSSGGNNDGANLPLSSSSASSSSSSSMLLGAIGVIDSTPIVSAHKIRAEDRCMSSDEWILSSGDEFIVNPVASTSAAAAAVTRAALIKAKLDPETLASSSKYIPPPSVAAPGFHHETPIVSAKSPEKPHIFSNVRPTEDAWDILLARAEGLHAHGHGREACKLAVRLAEEMLSHPPNLMVELPPLPKRKGKNKNINPASHHLTVLASATLSKCAFLCTVLSEDSEHCHISFRICLFALELPRPPASTKPLEVKLANQEADILALLKRIPLHEPELRIIRERAEQLKSGTVKSRGEALLPINMACFIFDALVLPLVAVREQRNRVLTMYARTTQDESLGFEAAVAALGLKANVSEAEHPLLCEGTRRQRGDLALTLLYYYKDEPRKIARIMEKLLDREIHVLLKAPQLSPAYYTNNPPVRTPATSHTRRDDFEHGVSNVGEVFYTDYGSAGGNSRPQSATSAEFEHNNLAPLSISAPQGGNGGGGGGAGGGGNAANGCGVMSTAACNNGNGGPGMNAGAQAGVNAGGATSRSKDNRYKGKRAYPSIPNQPSEASAHFMFELAKNVLTKAGGNSSTSLFTQASTNQNHHGPHRALHMCAFQLGLYALGLHNCVSPNWLSRTYSSHVSWISGQAMESGAPAISLLIDTWEGHLTPPEAAGMADRASRGWDNNMVYPAAELALSVLPHAAALNPNEIQRAILQCKEQSDSMLERACITVEKAAKGGGVYPEVLFQVGRYWYELYLRHTPASEHEQHDDILDHSAAVSLSALIESQGGMLGMAPGPPVGGGPPTGVGHLGQVVVAAAPPPSPFQQGVAALAPLGLAPYPPFCQGIYHHNLSYPPQMYISAGPPQQYQVYKTPGHQGGAGGGPPGPGALVPAPSYGPGGAGLPPQAYQTITGGGGPTFYGQVPPYLRQQQQQQQQQQQSQQQQQPQQQQQQQGGLYPFVAASQLQLPPAHAASQQARQRHPHQYTATQLHYLLSAYNVGMLALETLARRVHDDRPQAKYARSPPYGEDVKWLLRISKKLGTQYLHQFCLCALDSIVSPFVLHDVAIESAHYLGRNNHHLAMQHLRTALTPLVNKCQQMYIQCIHQKLYHLTQADYEDFANIILSARAAFQLTADGSAQFKDWLQSLKRSKSCKKELWAQINAALASTSK